MARSTKSSRLVSGENRLDGFGAKGKLLLPSISRMGAKLRGNQKKIYLKLPDACRQAVSELIT
jgi:hypothetical protein